MRWAVVFLVGLFVASCVQSYRLDFRRQELQKKQDECLKRGGSPEECRP
jgi:hypothetical protein